MRHIRHVLVPSAKEARISWSVNLFFVVAAMAVAALIFWRIAPFYNPDASAYFGMALRFSQLEFFSAGHLMHSPLLPLLMAPLVACGVPIYLAFQIITVLLTGALCALMLAVAHAAGVNRGNALLISAITALQVLPYLFISISGDFSAAITLLTVLLMLARYEHSQNWTLLIIAGTAAACAYLAKAIEFPIVVLLFIFRFLFQVTLDSSRKLRALGELVCLGAAFIAFSAPWIAAVSQKAGALAISGQFMVVGGQYDLLKYHPDLPLDALQGSLTVKNRPSLAESLVGTLAANAGNRLEVIGEIIRQFFSISVSAVVFAFMVGIVVFGARRRGSASGPEQRIAWLVCAALILQLLVYLAAGGAYSRYYLPALCQFNLLFAVTFERVIRRAPERLPISRDALARLVLAVALVLSLCRSGSVIAEIMNLPADARIERALNYPELTTENGPLVGNLDAPVTGYVAYALRRESWGFVTAGEAAAGQLVPKLRLWKVGQLLWFGEPPVALLETPEVRLIRDSGNGAERILLFAIAGT